MELVFSSDQLHPRDRFDCWHDLVCRTIAEHDCEPESRTEFRAMIERGTVGVLELVRFQAPAMRIFHTSAHTERTRADHLFVCCQLAGKVRLIQNGREIVLAPGTLTLLDPRMPYDGRVFGGSTMLLLKVPRRELEARIGRSRDLTARLVSPARADDVLTLQLLHRLPSLSGQLSSPTEDMTAAHALDLIGVSIAHTTAAGRTRRSSARALLLARIRAEIEARLPDPELDARRVADAVGVSVRYANELLAEQDTSIKRFILNRRLARCRSALEDSGEAHRTVSEIAFGWGFSDLTHFGRRFKEAYGASPSDYQTLARRASSR